MAYAHPAQVRDREATRALLRRHPATFVGVLVKFLLLLAIPAVIFTASTTLREHVAQRDAAGIALVLGLTCYLLLVGLLLLHSWVLYYLDVWFVTDQRVIDVAQRNLFSRVISELPLDQIQDITVEVHGVLPTLLHYGDVIVQTAGETPRFCLDNIPNPHAVAHLIMEQRQGIQRGANQQQTA